MPSTPTARKLRVAAVTLDGLHEPARDTLPRILSWLKRCSGQGAEVALFPECALGHYFDDPIPVEGATVGALVEAVRALGLHVGIGLGERAGDRRYSSYLLVGPEGIVGHHRKTRWQTEPCPIDLGAEVQMHLWGGIRTGVLVCSESWHQDRLAEELKAAGAELLIVPAAVGFLPERTAEEQYAEMLVANARLMGVAGIAVGGTSPGRGRHANAGSPTELCGGCMVVDSVGDIRYWRLSNRPEMHRFELHLPEGRAE